MSQKCAGCNTEIPYGASKCPMCGAPAQTGQPPVVVIPPPDDRERIVWEGVPMWKAYAPLFVLAVLTIPVFIISIGIIVYVLIDKYRYQYKVTTKRVICTYGILSKRTSELDIVDIRSTNVTQNFIDRMLNVGNIEFATASGPMKEAVIVKVEDPVYLKEKIRGLRGN